MTNRRECIILNGLEKPFRILHISDIHFSRNTTHEENISCMNEILHQVKLFTSSNCVIAITGDLLSRKINSDSVHDALIFLNKLRKFAPVVYSFGNHEMDLPVKFREKFSRTAEHSGIMILDNQTIFLNGVNITGLTLPQTVYKNQAGNYFQLEKITPALLETCVGKCTEHPCILLAHSPIGFPAYAEWNADFVLSGHVHGGMIRLPKIGGLFSPERKFFPEYTKGIYKIKNCYMNVSAGIGKFRLNNPPEIVCIDLLPKEGGKKNGFFIS